MRNRGTRDLRNFWEGYTYSPLNRAEKQKRKVGYVPVFSLILAFLFAACLSRIPRIFTLLAAAFSYRLCLSSGVRVIYATFLPKAQISQSSTKAERDNCPLWASIILRAFLLRDSDVLSSYQLPVFLAFYTDSPAASKNTWAIALLNSLWSYCAIPVSYTHLTLPTNREV